MKNRDIKFRAWNNEDKEMIFLEHSGLQYYDFEGAYSLGFTVDAYSGFWGHECLPDPSIRAKSFPITQFTGLVDKLGKDVYEGDIVVYQKQVKIVVWDSAHLCWVLVWPQAFITIDAEYRNGCNPETSGMTYDKVTGTKILNVIGNIFENPKLIN